MDKKAIKTFAIESRKKLIEEVKYQASLLGITADGIAEPVKKAEGMEVYDIGASTPNTIYDEAIKQRESLVKRINEKGFDSVMEEVAYTWFNRIIAIRFMEVNDYLPTRIRVLSSEKDEKTEPDIVTEAPNIDLDFTDEEIDQIYQLKNDNKLDVLFKLLFIKQCNKLNEILPELFEKTADYTELLLSISFTNEEGVVRQLIDNISEEDFTDQVEIIGWLYQYYITELNDLVYDGSFKKDKIPKELLPAATQLFTPDWPVKYMVENSLGRLWLETHHNDDIKKNWKYYLDNNELVAQNSEKLDPESITVFDPCMGSGHILSYAFDVLMDIYKSSGYNERDASRLILEKNIYGIDIDDRAYQLAYFSLLMKARKYNRRIFQKDIKLNFCSIKESNSLSTESLDQIIEDDHIKKNLEYVIDIFKDAKEYGSILNINSLDFNELYDFLNHIPSKSIESLYGLVYAENILNQLFSLIMQAELLSKKYDVVFTNPPYLNSSRFNFKLLDYVKKNFPDTKTDLATTMYQKSIKSFCKDDGFVSFITTTSWMFLKNFKKLRKTIIKSTQFESLVDFGTELFEGKVGHNPIVAWVNKNRTPSKKLIAIKLSEYNYSRRHEKESEFFNENNKFFINQEKFLMIPGNPIAYWLEDNFISLFLNENIYHFATVNEGLKTGDNKRFIRKWFEVNIQKTNIFNSENCKWFKHTKGGKYKKWYGNNEDILDFEKNGYELKNFKKASISGEENYFKENVTWSRITSYNTSFRFTPKGFIPNMAGLSLYSQYNEYLLGYLNSKISTLILEVINPTLNFPPGTIGNVPIIFSEKYKEPIQELVKENIKISHDDWDSFEKSWDFKVHPFLKISKKHALFTIRESFEYWSNMTENRFYKIKNNEEKLNSLFIEINKIHDLKPEVTEKDITISRANLQKDVKSFMSYAVGCMFGRYSLDEEGLIYAGGDFNSLRYSKFIPDDDNIIPILDTEYFEDDIVGRFVEFVKITFGEETLEENLDFIASALKKRGNTNREIIRNYFLSDFYEDHFNLYSCRVIGKLPIYWLFDSGKNNGFKALIYMHRYETDLLSRMRINYLHKTQKAIENAINNHEKIIENPASPAEKSKAVKAKNKLSKQLEETRKYDEALAHIANQRIPIDLDDGVKVNYAKFQGVEVSKEGKKATKIDLLKKI